MEFLILVGVAIGVGITYAVGRQVLFGRDRSRLKSAAKSIPDFTPSLQVMGADGRTGLAVDQVRRKVCLLAKEGGRIETRVVRFADVLGVETIEDGVSITQASVGSMAGRALAGGVVFGPLGAVVGGLTGKKKSKNSVSRLDLRVAIRDLSRPMHIVSFMNIEASRSSSLYKKSERSLAEWRCRMEALVSMADAALSEDPDADRDGVDYLEQEVFGPVQYVPRGQSNVRRNTMLALGFIIVVLVVLSAARSPERSKQRADRTSQPIAVEIEKLASEVRALPASDVDGNLKGYRELLLLDPGNELFQRKVEHYESKARQARSNP